MSTREKTITRKLASWDTKASVRVKPRRLLLADEEATGKVYFSPELVPVAQHPLVAALGGEAVRELQVQHLYRYLDFTTQLELEVINTVAKEVALGKLDTDLPDIFLEDAFKLCTDEAHHAYFSDDVRRQVAAATGIVPIRNGVPRFLTRLRAIQRDLSPELAALSELLFAVVSETLISGILCQIPKDERVVTAVRQIIADHAEDEGRHSAYFSQLFAVVWPQLSDSQQSAIGPLLPHFILAFLEPDAASIRRGLSRLPLRPEEVEAVFEQSYPASRVAADARAAAQVTLRLFEHEGVFSDSRITDEFWTCGLLE